MGKLPPGFDSTQLDWAYGPVIQSGGNYDLRLTAVSNSNNLHAGIIVAGFGATAIRDAPYAGLYVLIYEQSKAQLGKMSHIVAGPNGEPAVRSMSSSAGINFVSGVVAAMAATTLTNPFDAIKTRLQIAPGKYRNMLQAAKMMLQQEGVKSMFYGLSLRIGRKAVSSALTWTVYEELIRRAENALEEKAAIAAR